MRNWPKTVPGASFRGTPFHVSRETVDDAGRYVAFHPFAKAETHGTEDMGRKAWKFRVQAYLTGDTVDADAMAFLEVCSTPGAGMLILPMLPGIMVRCLNCSRAAEKNSQGYVQFDLEFGEAGAQGGGFPAIPLGDRIAEGVLNTLPRLIGSALSAFGVR
ncbi:DNA circularization N-terminal domain-containing protein [Methylobacterium nodulans]|uniref:Putative Mu-like prophage DNA circulation protein n=1 Tax=Methylobacterium nodulans (strain LMG 21967 / CNCM I-2342 / ORS 2060) TaxID=460265 RepID=B8ICK8_METNO|nr:DNA circularization N-terminal domain-containing protein [Methylobacterium nodulans]ACL57419.1 putative Mu-like prophage DNA circulation protein [Methylobacterium nodulans ORS 2060]